MYRKTLSLISASLLACVFNVRADEGMWLPSLVEKNMATMTELGFKLSADDIYNINKACLKDAIIALDGGNCTASFVSPEGLIMTNHHCGYDDIQSHSTVENDLLTNGFFAMSKSEELANPGKTAWLLVRVEDVTSRIMEAVPENATFAQRTAIVDSVSQIIASEAEKDTHYDAVVNDLLYDNLYYLFVYEVFKDVRLVAAPPESEGKYGADTDNWMWPRHTCDFSMFRIYCAPDGSPAEYSEDNVPYKPKHFLPISLDGYKENDFAMVMGYPGSTDRYMSSWETQQTMDVSNIIIEKVRGVKQDIWKEYMDNDPKTRIQYAAKFASSSNYWKYSIGQNKGLKRLHIVDKKLQAEREFAQWVEADDARKAKYGNALELIEEGVTKNLAYKRAYYYLTETQMRGCESFYFVIRAIHELNEIAEENSERARQSLAKRADEFFRDYNPVVDKQVTKAMLRLYMDSVNVELYPSYIQNQVMRKGVDAYVDAIFAKSAFCDQEKFSEFIENLSEKSLTKDPIYNAAYSVYDQYAFLHHQVLEYSDKLYGGMNLFVEGLMQMYPDRLFSPDANSTMRLTYGTVGGYMPADAVSYDFKTTLDGVMEKADTTVREFSVSPKLKEIYAKKDYGRYGNPDSTMNVCFITNNDITGGNSGSPVINAKGELIGLAFDGNWEAMSGDIAYEAELQRCIAVDIRYVLLMIDKFAGAQNIIDELTLVE